MTNITDMATVAAQIPRPDYYSLEMAIFKSGPMAFFGWIALVVIPISATVVILRHLLFSGCHSHRTLFFQISHICFMIFLYIVVVNGLIGYCTCGCPILDTNFVTRNISENQISLGIGLTTVMISLIAVACVLKIIPKPDTWACVGLTAVAASVAIIAGGMLMISL
jgi:hypothetical protein